MAEIRLSDSTLLKVTDKVVDLRKMLAHDRFVQITDRDGKQWDVNPKQVVWMRDN